MPAVRDIQIKSAIDICERRKGCKIQSKHGITRKKPQFPKGNCKKSCIICSTKVKKSARYLCLQILKAVNKRKSAGEPKYLQKYYQNFPSEWFNSHVRIQIHVQLRMHIHVVCDCMCMLVCVSVCLCLKLCDQL